jgi:hypothetical protein
MPGGMVARGYQSDGDLVLRDCSDVCNIRNLPCWDGLAVNIG